MADAASPLTTLNYVKASTATTAFLGLPRLCQSPSLSVRQMKALVGIGAATESHPVTLHDARSDSSLRYETCGFKLEPLSSGVVDWSQVAKRGTPEHTLYKAELEAIVRRLHPDAKALAWSTFLLRGGPGENGPAAGAIHLDWYPDVAACKEFLSEHPEGYHDLKDTAAQVKSQPGNENLELKVVLGLWKPRNESNPVKEAPLIEQCFNVNAEGTSVPVANLAANLKHSERQKWYYFKDQTRDEVFVFRHATIEQPSFANFHCGGVLPLPAGMEKRSSVETRVMLYF